MLKNIIARLFGGTGKPSAPPLRNRPNGLAFINRNADEGAGTGALVGRYVTTRRIVGSDFWLIEPPQRYLATGNLLFQGCIFAPMGCVIICDAVRDASLTPVPSAGLSAKEVDALYAAPPLIGVRTDA